MTDQVDVQETHTEVSPEIVAEATRFGWKPKDEFQGNPDEWRDAETFVKKGREINGFLRKDMEKLERELAKRDRALEETREAVAEFQKYHADTEARAYKRALEELRQEKKEALELNDADRILEIDDRIDAIKEEQRTKQATKVITPKPADVDSAPDPEFINWRSSNTWYGADNELTQEADAQAEALRRREPQLVGRAFLDKVEAKVKRLYPEKFENQNRTRASNVDASGDSRQVSGKHSYDNLPPEAKKACDKFVAQKLLTREQFIKDYDWN